MNNWKLRHSFTGNATSDVQTVNGYLADPAYHLTTNLLLQSNQFDTTWSLVGTTVTSGQSGYDGTSDAWLLEASSVGTSYATQLVSVSGVQTHSVYAKAGTADYLVFYNTGGASIPRAWFNLSTGFVETKGFEIQASMESVGSGWYRCSLTYDYNITAVRMYVGEADGSFTTAVGKNIYIQDAQLEEGTQATTYVETTTEPVTLPDTFNVTVVPDGKEYAAPLFITTRNLIGYSEKMASIQEVGAALTITSNVAVAPDGTTSADKVEKTTGGYTFLRQIIATPQLSTFSVFVKKGNHRYIGVRNGGDGTHSVFDFDTETFTVQGDRDMFFDYVGDGWYRLFDINNSVTTTNYRGICISNAAGQENHFSIPLNAYAYVWGMQYTDDGAGNGVSHATPYIPTNGSAVTRDWSAFGRVQNQVPGICNGTHTHTGAASGSGIAATTITGSGSGATFAYDFDTLGVLTTLTADGAGSGYKVGDKLSIDTTEGHTIEFRLVEGSNAATVSVSMGAAKPNKPIPFPVSKMRVEGLTDRTVLFMDERSRYVFPKPTPYLLDTYEGAAAAYSLRRLRSSYTGPAVRVRRASNNDELDIYFNRDGSLDTATLEAFCAGTNGFVKVWFDQGQGGNDATQTTTASQPQIVASGSVVTENGQPALAFDGLNDRFPFDNSQLDIGSLSSFTVGKYADTSGSEVMLGLSGGVGNKRWYAPYLSGGDFNYGYGNQFNVMKTTADTNQNLHTLIAGSILGSAEAFFNSSSVGTQTLDSGIDVTNSGIMNLTAAFYSSGNLQEVIVYDSDQSANRAGIEDNINEHYGIYEFSGLLDDYSGAAAAYSLRRLSSTYTGPAIRVVKHDVGYPEMDIPFEDDGTLSVVLLEAFADGYDATVKVWYDQSGGSNDAEQSTLASQPKIVDAGTVIYENGLPAAQFDGADDYFTKAFTLGNPVSHFVVAQTANLNDFIIDGYGDVNRNSLVSTSTNVMRLYNGTGILQTYTAGTQSLFSSISKGAGSLFAVNGNSTTQTIGTNSMNGMTLGAAGTLASGFNLDGTIQEVIIYGSDQSANRTAIESNINDFYSIYP